MLLLVLAGCGGSDDVHAAAQEDAGVGDGAAVDASGGDGKREPAAAGRDAGPDALDVDAESPQDAGQADSGVDAGTVDAGTRDSDDAGTGDSDADAGTPCESSLPPIEVPPERLSELGLYADIASKEVAASMRELSPQFVLWSDGAVKTRWLYLPECDDVIGTLNMDSWSFPVGTRAYKEFAVDGKRIETRIVHRYGPGRDDFLFAHYLWDEDESEAWLVTEETESAALTNPKDTEYHVPTPDMCVRCHGETGGDPGGIPARYLGVSAIQLSHDGPGETLRSLSEGGHLSRPAPDGFVVPGKPRQRAALGYLHANCGMCHNGTRDGVHFPAGEFRLWLETDESLYETGLYETAIEVEPLGYTGDCTHRVRAGDPGLADPPEGPIESCLYERMRIRGPDQMPPLATHVVDEAGLAVIRDWIAGLGG